MSYALAARQGGMWGMRLGALFGPLGAAVGTVAGAAVGVGLRAGAGYLANQAIASQMSEGDNKIEEQLSEEETEEVCDSCGPEEPDPDDEEERAQRARDAKRMSTKKLEEAARNNGYDSAHDLKDDFGLDSRSDIFSDRYGEMYSGPRQGTGTMEPLGININGGPSDLIS